jgi:hypothetical protein
MSKPAAFATRLAEIECTRERGKSFITLFLYWQDALASGSTPLSSFHTHFCVLFIFSGGKKLWGPMVLLEQAARKNDSLVCFILIEFKFVL